jgi:hypothetical protein
MSRALSLSGRLPLPNQTRATREERIRGMLFFASCARVAQIGFTVATRRRVGRR